MKIAILTNFSEFNPGYSLTGIVQDQAQMLARHGHQVEVFVNEQYHGRPDAVKCARIRPVMPFAHLSDYQCAGDITPEHKETARAATEMLVNELADTDAVFTHDFMFSGWFLPYGIACFCASNQLPCAWLHWIHSIPTALRDWWDVRQWGPQHKIIYPNETDRLRVAEQYRGGVENVRVVPHIKDIRTWMEFLPDTRALIDQVPGILDAEVVQLLPASVDRLEAKRVAEVIRIFANIKALGRSVCLVVANQWATTRTRRESVAEYLAVAESLGLVPGKEVVFTSEIRSDYEKGISRRMIRELFACSNLFIFPSREESFGLVVPEAALAGTMCLLNKSLQQQIEISGNQAMYLDFGSYTHNFRAADPDIYYRDVAAIVLARMDQDESIRMKTFCRRRYNMDAVYRRYYAPLLAEMTGGVS